jgi:hypothetical protein
MRKLALAILVGGAAVAVAACGPAGKKEVGTDTSGIDASSEDGTEEPDGGLPEVQAPDETGPDVALPDVTPPEDLVADAPPADLVPEDLEAPDVSLDLGQDVQLPVGCCHSDAECINGFRCVGGDLGAGGVCFPPPAVGACFVQEDCPQGFICSGMDLCACNMDCLSQPGQCVPLPGDCCTQDAECPAGKVCAPAGDSGVCEPATFVPGTCWDEGDCMPGQECVGAWACPCNADCDGWDTPGTCQGPMDGCCQADPDCGPGMVCVGGEFELGGTCEPAPAFGECFKDSDCYVMSQACEGAITCSCGTPCFAPNTPGKCAPLPANCCYSDADCGGEEMVCKGIYAGDNMPGTCQPVPGSIIGCPYPGGCCWDDNDCLNGKKCVDAFVCGCIELCYVCGACMPDQMGHCE